MLKYVTLVVVLVSSLGFGLCGNKLPADFKLCKRHDPEINKCLKSAMMDAFPKMEKGIPDLSVSPLQPLNIPSVTIGEGKGPVNVLQKYKNVNLYNLINSKIEKIEASVDDPFKITMSIMAPEYRLEADYDFNGRILLLPIVGKGKCVITLVNTRADVVITAEKVVKKGKTYLSVNDLKVALSPEKVMFKFENLFNGDERLGKEMNTVLNENWNEVFMDVKPGYEEFIGSIGKHYTNSIFMKVPYDDMFPM